MSTTKGSYPLLLTTSNKGKIAEYKSILTPLQFSTPNENNIILKAEETGNSYWMNARIKAEEGFRLSGIPTIADDSGLEISALNGYPGLYSARYFSINGILNKMKNIENRMAMFICVMCFYDGKSYRYFEGFLQGIISHHPIGEKGFGYDPIFYLTEYNKTVAQLPPEEKNKISHRGKAGNKFKSYFAKLNG